MKQKTTYILFRQFLQKQGCEEAFDRHFEENHPGYTLDARLAEFFCIDCGTIGRAFRWDETPEGRDYWKDIDRIWNDIVKRG